MRELTVLEQIILASIIHLGDDAYGLSIRKTAKSLSGKSLMYGALYNALDQLSRKGFVDKDARKPEAETGGHERIYYAVTREGKQALRTAYRLHRAIWTSLPEITRELDRGGR